ncbi:zinc finger protein 567-like [Diaphorina citri]|nr:zinc finger protein 567-like [Diaphorina citri]
MNIAKSHVCETCGKGFRSRTEMRKHQETHNPIRSFACEHCDAAFTVKKYLVQHYKTHRLR